jgi:hypothetical protein
MSAALEPSDLVLLVLLGTADRAPVPIPEVVVTARRLAPRDWQPTTDTICSAVTRALADGLIATVNRNAGHPAGQLGDRNVDHSAGAATVLATTPLGRQRLMALLRKPIPRSTGAFIRACMTVKLCFLDALAQPERGDHADLLAHHYREAIDILRRLERLPRPLAGPALDELRLDIVRLESELAWLDGMSHWRAEREAAE